MSAFVLVGRQNTSISAGVSSSSKRISIQRCFTRGLQAVVLKFFWAVAWPQGNASCTHTMPLSRRPTGWLSGRLFCITTTVMRSPPAKALCPLMAIFGSSRDVRL